MANKSITMTKIKRILQLLADGTSVRGISKTVGIHRKTVEVWITKLRASKRSYSELLNLDDKSLVDIISPTLPVSVADSRYQKLHALFADFATELSKTGVTRKLLWEEYLATQADGYGYTQFCEHFGRYLKTNKATMHFMHIAGEYLQIDFAGKKLSYIDKLTGEIIYCPVLICTLAYSNYTYVEVLSSASQENLFLAMNRCMDFLGGVTKNILSDNMKQCVQKNERYEFTFQEVALQWSVHYNTNLEATRVARPKDKPTVENHVYIAYLRIYAQVRKLEFFSLEELNRHIRILLDGFNERPFQKLTGSRKQRFEQQEKPLLKALPDEPFLIKYTTKAKVQMNYHVILGKDQHQYSVPYQYIGKQTNIIYDKNTVEVYIGLERIALHRRSERQYAYTTLEAHMPQKHLHYKETQGWDADYFLQIAGKIGLCSVEVFKQILESKAFVEQTYKACIGLKRLAEIYTPERFEAACKRAISGSRVNYGIIKNILENNLDKQQAEPLSLFQTQQHENIRGACAYN